MEVLQQLAVLRPGQKGVGVERLLDGQTLVIVERFRALGGCGRDTEIIAFGPNIECVSPASCSTAAGARRSTRWR